MPLSVVLPITRNIYRLFIDATQIHPIFDKCISIFNRIIRIKGERLPYALFPLRQDALSQNTD